MILIFRVSGFQSLLIYQIVASLQKSSSMEQYSIRSQTSSVQDSKRRLRFVMRLSIITLTFTRLDLMKTPTLLTPKFISGANFSEAVFIKNAYFVNVTFGKRHSSYLVRFTRTRIS